MLGTDKYAYRSKIKNVDPVDKLLITLPVLLLCIFLNHWTVSLATLIGMIILNQFFGKNTLSEIGHMLSIPMGFILIGTLTVIVGTYDPKESLLIGLRIGQSHFGITLQSLMRGFEIIAKSMGVMSAVYFFVMNTTISDLSIAMQRLRVPRLFTELMELIYRFIFVLMESASKIKTAQNSRLGYKDFRTSYHSTGTLAARVFVDAMRRSDKIYNALDSRGYQGQILTPDIRYEKHSAMLVSGAIMVVVQILIFVLLRSL